MILCDNHWKFSTFSILWLWNKFSEKQIFKKLGHHFFVEDTNIYNATFPYKTALSEGDILSQDETCLGTKSYGEMSLTFYTFFPRWNLILGWNFISEWKRERKTFKHFMPGWNFEMGMFFKNFWRMYSLSKVNMMSELYEVWTWWNIRPLYKKWSPKRKKGEDNK